MKYNNYFFRYFVFMSVALSSIFLVSCKKEVVSPHTDNPVVSKPDSFSIGYSKTFGGTGYEGVRSVSTPDGGIVMAGFTNSTDDDVKGAHGKDDAWIVKLNSNGDTVWTRTMGGSANDKASDIIVTADGSYIITGSTDSEDGDITDKRQNTGTDAWLIKLDGNGHTRWSKTYGGKGGDAAYTVIATPDGGYIMAGATGSTDDDLKNNHGGIDVLVIKIDNGGKQQWAKAYGGSQWEEVHKIINTPDGYVLSGLTYSSDGDVTGYHVPVFTGADFLVLKIDFSGNKIWAKAFGGTTDEVATSIAAAPDGYVVSGYTNSNDGDVTGYHGKEAFFIDIWVLKLGNDGNIVWAKTFGGKYDDAATSLIATPDGGYVLSGSTSSNDGDVTGNHNTDFNDDILVLKLDAAGNKQWLKTFGGSLDDGGSSISVNTTGYTITGITTSTDGDVKDIQRGQYDVWALKLIVQ